MATWKNRIVKHDVLPAKDFLAHPMNFRIHPQVQQLATQGSLDELGWIDEVIVNIETQHVINGHLRISLALRLGDDTPVPVKYVRLSPEEEMTALAIFDPITGLAIADKEKLDTLLRETKPADAALQQFLGELAAKEGLYTGDGVPVDDPLAEWQGMPEFEHEDKTAFQSIVLHFKDQEAVDAFAELLRRRLVQKRDTFGIQSKILSAMETPNNPRYPIYIVSKGRWDSRLTSKALEWMKIDYRIVVEPQEFHQYATVIGRQKILVLPFAGLGQGSIPARNWIWEHAIAEGHRRHWILDDNIRYFHRFNHNRRYVMRTGATFRAAEDFVDRYDNVAMAGFQYEKFVPVKVKHIEPFSKNTRIYSCILLDNHVPFRWRGRYNEDTDLSLQVLKAGYCTILFYAFLAEKTATMTMKGGNTDALYKKTPDFDGRLEMARSLQRQHPDVVKITRKWNRWQHQVDYRPFKANRLIRKPGVVIPDGINDYGMRLVRKS